MATWSRMTRDRLRFASAERSGVLGEGKGNMSAALLIGELCPAPPPFLLFPPPGVKDVEV